MRRSLAILANEPAPGLIQVKVNRRWLCFARRVSLHEPAIALGDVTVAQAARSSGHEQESLWNPPGGLLVWIVVFVELVTFAAGFVVLVVQGQHEPEAFRSARALLNQPVALANTFLLLTGGWCMANGISCLRRGQQVQSGHWVAAAIATGLGFLVLKCTEYAEKIRHGIGFGEDTFFTTYYLLTGFHFLHVAVAVVFLGCMWAGVRKGRYHQRDHQDVESSGVFWHLCDLVWLLLYPLLYLLP